MKKSSRSYGFSMIMAQMLILPGILTIVFQMIGPSLDARQGNYMSEFRCFTAALLGPLLIGLVLGAIFSTLYKNKPDLSKSRYGWLAAPMAYALVFAVVIFAVTGGNFRNNVWVVYALKNPSFIIIDFGLSFFGFASLMPVIELSGYAGFAAGFLAAELVRRRAAAGGDSRALRMSAAALAVVCLLYTGATNKSVIESGLIELRYGETDFGSELTEFNLSRIAPFTENNGLAQLDHPASLQWTTLEELPRLDGATAAYPVYGAFIEAVYKGLGDYYRTNDHGAQKADIFVDSNEFPYSIVRCTKTQQAYDNLIYGETDIIFVAEPSQAQLERVRARNDDFVLTPIGSEAFVLFTNADSPVDNLTVEQIRDIYTGRVTNWKSVGGPDKKILAYQRPEDSGSQTVMQNKVMGGDKMMAPDMKTRVDGMGGIIRKVADYQNARNSIGYSFMYYSSTMVKENRIKYLGVNGVKPTGETVRNKSYPFTVPVYAVTLKSNTKPNVAKLLEWVLSEEGQSLVEKTGYVAMR